MISLWFLPVVAACLVGLYLTLRSSSFWCAFDKVCCRIYGCAPGKFDLSVGRFDGPYCFYDSGVAVVEGQVLAEELE